MPVPPLPDMLQVLDRSTLIDERPGLRDHARLWLAWGPVARAVVAEEAALLARPSLRPASLRAVGRTGADLARGVAPGLRDDARRRIKDGPLDKSKAMTAVGRGKVDISGAIRAGESSQLCMPTRYR